MRSSEQSAVCRWLNFSGLENETHLIAGRELCEYCFWCISDCKDTLWWTQWMSHVAINGNTGVNSRGGGGGVEGGQ